MDDNPYRSPESERGAPRPRSSAMALALRTCMVIVGSVVIWFGALNMLRPRFGLPWYFYPAAVCLVGAGSCLVWWACERR